MRIANRYSLSVLASLVHATLAAAAPSSTSSYAVDHQNSYVEDETSRGIGQVNMITCIMSALRPDAMVNEGPYNALIDQAKCDPEQRSSGTSTAATYTNAVVDSTRTSNDVPMAANVWIDDEEEGQKTMILVHVSASEAPTTANPYGIFRVDYCGTAEGFSGCLMNGFLDGAANGISYYEDEMGDHGSTIKALRLNATGTTSGSGRLQIDGDNEHTAFDFAYNASLFRRVDNQGGDQCFTRDASDPGTGFSVWRYGLYDETTGARIERNSGFPIEFVSGGKTYNGYLGYYGLSLQSEAMAALTNGSTVQRVDYGTDGGAPTKTDYTVAKADGKLTKYTRHTRTLQSIDKIKFQLFVGNMGGALFAGAQQDTQYEMYWDEANSTFKVTGQVICGNNGCFPSALPQEESVAVAYFQNMGGVNGWSQSLGGQLFINLNNQVTVDSAATDVVYRTQDLVYPSDMPATLYCVNNCPTAATMESYFNHAGGNSPFTAATSNNFMPAQLPDVVTYQADTGTGLLTESNAPVVYTNADALRDDPQYQSGVRSGRLFTTLADAECGTGQYCDYKVNDVEVYYQWETGVQPFNQFAAVKDSSGAFVHFDAPLNVNFEVPNDPAKYGEFAGQTLLLQYSGFGELMGIPGKCVSSSTNLPADCSDQTSRYVAAFMIPADATIGRVTTESSTYLVKWLEREIRFARKSTTECDDAGLQITQGLVLPTSSDLKDPSNSSSDIYVGTRPTATGAPRVIQGEVKY